MSTTKAASQRKRENISSVTFPKEKEEAAKDKIKRGRKLKPDNKEHYRKEHNKNSEDNIIKKIKAKILLYPLMFLNSLLEKTNIYKERLYKLDYKYINQLKKEEDMNFLKMSLKELYSLDISPKYKKSKESKDYNKQNIESIIKKVKDYPTIMLAFNLSFGDWMELFSYKRNINDIIKKYEGIHNVNEEIIEKSLIGANHLLNKILKNNDERYFSIFTLFLYNYKRWFYIKNRRNKK